MGLFWDLFQQSQISQHSYRADDLEDRADEFQDRAEELEERVARLEKRLLYTQQLLRDVIGRLEQHLGQDLDQNGRVG